MVNPVWYFDCTGYVIRSNEKGQKIYLYSLVIHDRQTQTEIPIGEFLNTAQDQDTIATLLFRINLHIQNNMSEKCPFKCAPIVVTDFSWALLNATHRVFNSCDVLQYLNYCYTAIFDLKQRAAVTSAIKCRTYICSTHMLKIIIKHSKEIYVSG